MCTKPRSKLISLGVNPIISPNLGPSSKAILNAAVIEQTEQTEQTEETKETKET
jgi:hypothetical protein